MNDTFKAIEAFISAKIAIEQQRVRKLETGLYPEMAIVPAMRIEVLKETLDDIRKVCVSDAKS